ncbi:IQ motif, EF-hand binding site [Dillenia turbinata]|uniref:IQ motif, EF-hand binding site n=1 Tax=Dillenia turbinata TaxID=194707 RepID=A0AAN8VI70_9MAGN
MECTGHSPLAHSEIHGFHTMNELDVANIMEEAKIRWLRPNEIHAILCNYVYFTVHVKPVNLPPNGTLVLFDRKKLRNFRRDGYNWKKKKDGKTIREAHEHLKVGNEERIHVYYAHGQDKPNFVRRCYWLLDKSLEHIVLVHYRETQESQGSPVNPVNSDSSPALSDPPAAWVLPEEQDTVLAHAYSPGRKDNIGTGDSMSLRNHEMRLHEINTLEWEDLLGTDDPNHSKGDKVSILGQQTQYNTSWPKNNGGVLGANNLAAAISSTQMTRKDSAFIDDTLDILVNDGLQNQDSFGRWMNYVMTDSPGSVDDPSIGSPLSAGHESYLSTSTDQSSVQQQIFNITDISPAWAFSSEETKILIIGSFPDDCLHLVNSKVLCVCADACVPAENVKVGVFRCILSPHTPGVVSLYLSLDGHKPISQVITFEYRNPVLYNTVVASEEETNIEELQVQMRLAHLLFSSSKCLSILSSKVPPNALKEAKRFALKTSHIIKSWENIIESIGSNKMPYAEGKSRLIEHVLKNRLLEWLMERVVDGCKITDRDDKGQGVIHLCAILGYTWAVYPYSWSGLSLDYRDKYGWTALHWAAYYGREKMVAVLLSAGAKPNLVADPTSEFPGGCTAADIASKMDHEGLAAYLAEKALVAHFKDMTIAGNITGSLQTSTDDPVNPQNVGVEELYLKDSLAAFRTAADAAARIQAAFREHSFKLRSKAVEDTNTELEARNIIAAMKIQHAFRNYEARKKMAAAARIQYRFRTWKMRREFLNMRRQAIRIQAAFRGFQVRRQYRKILWSVGVLEKAILRWRLKRKGLRGLQVELVRPDADQQQESDAEEEFFKVGRKQAEDRMERSVTKVQALFRSKKAQEEYQRMKLAHNQAMLEYDELENPDADMVP